MERSITQMFFICYIKELSEGNPIYYPPENLQNSAMKMGIKLACDHFLTKATLLFNEGKYEQAQQMRDTALNFLNLKVKE